MFNFGDTFGACKAVCACLDMQLQFVSPVTWKKHYKISKEKEVSRALAINLFPEAAHMLSRKMDHNRAEALLIAEYGRTQL